MPCDIKSLITKEFLEHIFHKPVENFTYSIATKPGDNFLSCAYAVQVKVKDGVASESETKSIFLKCYPEDSGTCQFLDSVSIFATEFWIYDKFIPVLNGLARELLLPVDGQLHLEKGVLVNVAKFYGGNIVNSIGEKLSTFDREPWLNENFIILEDLRPKGYQMLDRTKGLDLNHCLLTINQLANLHALSWVYKRRNNLHKLVDKHPCLHDAMNKKENEPSWRPILEGLNRNALKVIQQELGVHHEVSLKLKELLSLDTLEMQRNFMSCSGIDEKEAESLLRIKSEEPIPANDEPWTVATHGDCWINNLLFNYADEDGSHQFPSNVVLIDHQAFREACLTTDLTYFIYSSIKPAMRKHYTDILLKTYFDKFINICQGFGENPPPGFTFKGMQRRWRRSRVYGLILSIQFVAFMYKPSLLQTVVGKEEEGANDESESLPGGEISEDDEWKKVLIGTMLEEYNDGIL